MRPTTIIADIMNRELPAIPHQNTLEDASQEFVKHQCHYLPVLNDKGQLVGILSTLDVLSTAIDYVEMGPQAFSKAKEHLRVTDLMTREFYHIQEHATVQEALELFENEQCWALPVLSGSQLVGMITSFDLVNYFTHLSKYTLSRFKTATSKLPRK